MNASDHLTRNQITAFSAGSLAERESREIGRHLLGCVDCRGQLPLPDPTNFWTAVMSEHDSKETTFDDELSTSIGSHGRALVEFFSKPHGLAWGSGVLVLIMTLTLLFLLTIPEDSSFDGDVAKSFENVPSSDRPEINAEPPSFPIAAHSNGGFLTEDVKRDSQGPKPRVSVSESRKNKKIDAATTGTGIVAAGNNAVSQTRGSVSKCGDAGMFEMEFGSLDEALLLKWKKYPGAVKYHVYVSDEDEILIDEFETEKATSYTLTKPLEQKKSYRWKVVITLENGTNLSVPSQKFGADDLVSTLRPTRAKRRVETRCLIDRR